MQPNPANKEVFYTSKRNFRAESKYGFLRRPNNAIYVLKIGSTPFLGKFEKRKDFSMARPEEGEKTRTQQIATTGDEVTTPSKEITGIPTFKSFLIWHGEETRKRTRRFPGKPQLRPIDNRSILWMLLEQSRKMLSID